MRGSSRAGETPKSTLYLQQLLTEFNDRDVEKIGTYLSEIEGALSNKADLERLLFGGSVAKHTHVEGLSDIDALVLLREDGATTQSASQVIAGPQISFRSTLAPRRYRINWKRVSWQLLSLTTTGQKSNCCQQSGRVNKFPSLRHGPIPGSKSPLPNSPKD